MTTKTAKPKTYKTQASIRDLEKFQASLRCYDWLAGIVPGAMDLDLVIERKGRILIWEMKSKIGGRVFMPLGQYITLSSFGNLEGVEVWLIGETADAKLNAKERFSVAPLSSMGRPDFETVHNGVRSVAFYLDERFTSYNLAGLQRAVKKWWENK